MKTTAILFCACLFACAGLHAQADTVTLKNGKVISGYIFKMDEGKISIAAGKDTSVYNADEIKSMMFCHKTKGSGDSYGKGSKSYSSSSESYGGNPCNEDELKKGKVVFQCNMCGGTVMLEITGGTRNNKSSNKCSITLDEGKSFFEHIVKLYPGEYTWKYHDSNNNKTGGTLTVGKGDDKKIVLFEN